jgi:predicted transposase/invertase (TIGR01784 family)
MSTPTPHDAVFKVFLSDPETARDFLAIHLPARLQQVCDLSTLRLEPGSYIDRDLLPFYSDVVYSLKTANGHKGYIYTVIEHQSTPDKLIPFRLMRYTLGIMQHHLRQGYDQLPLVIPMLFYHGMTSPYPFSMDWLQLFSEPDLARTLYNQPFPLVDVTAIPDNEIMQQKRMALLEIVLKHARVVRDLMELADPIRSLLKLGLCTHEQLETLLTYMADVGDTADPAGLLRILAQSSPEYEEIVMTMAQKLEKIGEKRGLDLGEKRGLEIGEQRGMEKGRQEGIVEGKRAVARTLLMNGVAADLVMTATGLTAQELEQLKH